MEKKKVLIISYSYPPSNVPAAQRPYTVAKYLNKDVFDITVLTCGNRDISWGINEGFDPELPKVNLIKINSLLGRGASSLRKSTTTVKKSLINRLKSSLFNLLSSMIVPDQAIFWYPKVRKYLLQNKHLINETKIVFTTSPSFSNHLIGKFIKAKNKNILWVSELRDFHFIETVSRPKNLKQLINKKLEYLVLKGSDKISFISHAMKDKYQNHYPKLINKFNVIYNGFEMSDFKNLRKKKLRNQKLTIFYAGSFYGGVRTPIPLFKILDKLIEKDKISLVDIEIRIAGKFENQLNEDLKKYISYNCINLIGNIPRSKVLEHIVSVDLLWLIVGNKSTHYTGFPIKFFEYLGARRPIINFAPEISEPSKFIVENDLGWNFDTMDFNLDKSVEIFEKIIIDYKSGKLSESLGYKIYPDFDRKNQGHLFEELFS
ncbi:hypothetical protein OAI39_03950 [Polaribacter sp.]|nr:hypothetical protein [Polaribacter sp.]